MAAPAIDSDKRLNRADLTRRLVAKLTRAEAVVAGIGWLAGRRPGCRAGAAMGARILAFSAVFATGDG